ncbi:hypothetical protein Daus18300_005685 [Diaporthe australafricana]|uniref:Uncharacterized protein n=1 Tax=Diaporthe australafricana TaxID=127596 RepID=A0ABR3WZL6_9PEZI
MSRRHNEQIARGPDHESPASDVREIYNDGEAGMCAVFAVADSLQNHPGLAERISYGGSHLAVFLYEAIVRAIDRADESFQDPGMRSGPRGNFRVDQIQAGLDEVARVFELGNITLGVIERDPFPGHRAGQSRRILYGPPDNPNTLWIAHHGRMESGTWRGIRENDGQPLLEHLYNGTVTRVQEIERLRAARRLQWRDVDAREMATWASTTDQMLRFDVAAVARRVENSERPDRETGLEQPQRRLRGGSRMSIQTLRGHTNGAQLDEATEPEVASLPVWTGPPGYPQIIFPGNVEQERFAVVEMPEGQRLLPLYLIWGSQEPGALMNYPDEVIHASRMVVLAQTPQILGPEVRRVLEHIVSTVSFRIQLTLQPIWRLLSPAETSGTPHPLIIVAGSMLVRARPDLRGILRRRARGWNMEHLMERDVRLHVDEQGRVHDENGRLLAANLFPESHFARRHITNSARIISDGAFIDNHEEEATAASSMSRLLGQVPTQDQLAIFTPTNENVAIRVTFGDGYLRTPEIVDYERMVRPYSRLVRTARSMQFAESVGATTDADRLDFDEPGPDEGEFYRDQRQERALIQELMNRESTERDEVIQEVLLVGMRVLGNLQSRLARIWPLADRARVYFRIRNHILRTPYRRFQRAFLNNNNRGAANRFIRPVILAAITGMVGPPLANAMSSETRRWIGLFGLSIMNLRSATGQIRGQRLAINQEVEQQHELDQQ